MSVIPTLNTIISLLSFLTVIFALARVGAAAFSANQARESGSSRSAPGSSGEKTHRSWQLSRAVAAPAAHLLQLQLAGGATGSGGIPSSYVRFGPSTPSADIIQAIRYGLTGGDPKQGMRDKEKGKDSDRMVAEYIGGHELVRMPASTWTGVRRPGILHRPPSPFPDQTKPLSMAKLIMSRHQNQRRTNRPPPVRRPPGLPAQPTSRSRLVEEV